MIEDRHLELLLRLTRDRDVPCPTCGYNLRNMTGAVCPECGATPKVRVGAGIPEFRLLLATMMPMIAYCGFAAWLAVPVGVAILYPRVRAGIPGFMFFLAFLGLLDAAAIWALYMARMRFLALPQTSQLAIAAIAWILHGILTAVVIAGN